MKKQTQKPSVTALIGGTSLTHSELFSSWKTKQVKTAFGIVQIKRNGDIIFLQRHGKVAVPPHMINHRANIQAIINLGAANIIAINSVGSLKTELKPGAFIIPDDFISLCQTPTFFEKEMRFTVPEMDKKLARSLYDLCKKQIVRLRFGGTYVQTIGPRLETKAEISMLKEYGHIIGMTMASEATLCMEQGIPYASLCSVDNYCNGIIKVPLTMEQITDSVRNNTIIIEEVIRMLITQGIS